MDKQYGKGFEQLLAHTGLNLSELLINAIITAGQEQITLTMNGKSSTSEEHLVMEETFP